MTEHAAPSQIRLRRASPADSAAVDHVHRLAFADGDRVPDLVQALQPHSRFGDDPGPLSLVAEMRGEVVGHVLLSRGLIDAWEALVPVLVLSPLGVLPDHQRSGVGTALVRSALQLASETGCPAVFLEGSPAYYSRHGFAAAMPLGFERPSKRIPAPGFQVALLQTYQQWMTGQLIYPPAFWDNDGVGLRGRERVARIEQEAAESD